MHEFTLDALEKMLDPDQFFRLNRSVILNRNALEKVSTHYSGKLIVELKGNQEIKWNVSKGKAGSFKQWLS